MGACHCNERQGENGELLSGDVNVRAKSKHEGSHNQSNLDTFEQTGAGFYTNGATGQEGNGYNDDQIVHAKSGFNRPNAQNNDDSQCKQDVSIRCASEDKRSVKDDCKIFFNF